ncbi:hypothetical protein [Streptomyces sp. NRRL F-5135]|uniref:hypothetical protein n=1 Tax=Streptomyces sp. NRRL F-5135 TaxID=1463858 RepID=UPI0004CB7CF9|nr:hypothetical protein [Streptomyces sp. NRRL F-5135]
MPTSRKPTTSEPPAAAVAQDAHWAAKMQRLRDRRLAEAVFTVCDDLDVKRRYDRAARAKDTAETLLNTTTDGDTDAQKEADAAREEWTAAKTAYDAAAIPIRLRALPRTAMEALYAEHKPTEEEQEEGRDWAPSFHAALISAASVDGMTVDEAQELLDTWSLAEANALFNAALSVQQTTRSDLGKG